MRKYLLAFVFFVTAAWAVNVKLYLKDGSFHVVREYKVEADRVRYYSTERSEWEEIPLDLVDLKKTQTEQADRQEKLEKDAKVISAEEKVEREIQKQITRIPQNPGVCTGAVHSSGRANGHPLLPNCPMWMVRDQLVDSLTRPVYC